MGVVVLFPSVHSGLHERAARSPCWVLIRAGSSSEAEGSAPAQPVGSRTKEREGLQQQQPWERLQHLHASCHHTPHPVCAPATGHAACKAQTLTSMQGRGAEAYMRVQARMLPWACAPRL